MNLKRTVLFVILPVLCISTDTDRSDGICNETKKFEYAKATISGKLVYCCSEYEEKADGTCQKCRPGFTSSNGSKCERCPEGRYGVKCYWECNCDRNKRCDHVEGCVAKPSTEVSITHKPDEDLSDKKKRSGTGIEIYLICISVALLVFIMFVIVWKYRQSMLKLITCTKAVCSLKRQHDEDNNKTDGYTVIDELYLVEKTLSQK